MARLVSLNGRNRREHPGGETDGQENERKLIALRRSQDSSQPGYFLTSCILARIGFQQMKRGVSRCDPPDGVRTEQEGSRAGAKTGGQGRRERLVDDP